MDELRARGLPDVLAGFGDGRINDSASWKSNRGKIHSLLAQGEYGFSPPPPEKVWRVEKSRDENAFAGKAIHCLVDICFHTPRGLFSFPLNLVLPKRRLRAPLILHIAFRPEVPDRYYPTEEIIDRGYASALFCYQDISPDRDDGFAEGLPGMYADGRRNDSDWGKIAVWAWAASRAMDYLQGLAAAGADGAAAGGIDRDMIDIKKVTVAGHSRLGKSALWCAASDGRFACAMSNDSGCSGAAVARGKAGERIVDIVDRFPYWFCANYGQYRNAEDELPFDQHFLLSLVAPRLLYAASAVEDQWADPKSEYLSCRAASDVYRVLGLPGLAHGGAWPEAPYRSHGGTIGYHLRKGTHFFSREDWNLFMDFLDAKWGTGHA
jgi:hypothetical protein